LSPFYHLENVDNFASKAHTANDNDEGFQSGCTDQLTSFYGILQGIHNNLGGLNSEKGEAAYDRSNDLETMIRGLVNDNKNLLSDTDNLVEGNFLLAVLLEPCK